MQVNLVDNVTVDAVLRVNMERGRVYHPKKFYTFLPLKVPFPVLRVKMETAGRLLAYSIFLTEETMKYLPAG